MVQIPEDFVSCLRRGGHVRTKVLPDNKFIRVCFIDGKSFAGEVKEKKMSHHIEEEKKKKESMVKWTAKYVNDLPDSAFAIVLPGGEKDENGKTVPRGLRKLPFKDKEGKIDLPHLTNALARVAQKRTELTDEQRAKAKRKLLNATKKAGINKRGRKSEKMKEVQKMVKKLKEQLSDLEETVENETVVEDASVENSENVPTEDESKEEGGEDLEDTADNKEEEEGKTDETSEESTENIEDSGSNTEKVVESEEEKTEEVKETKEELSVYKEIREELAKLYKEGKKQEENIEKLNTEVNSLKLENIRLKDLKESLSSKVVDFEKEKEKQVKAEKFEKLKDLSGKFKELGQDKSVEQLSKLEDSVIQEFETVVDLALNKKSSEQLEKITLPSQAAVVKQVVVKPINSVKKNQNFFEQLTETLKREQEKEASANSRKVLNL